MAPNPKCCEDTEESTMEAINRHTSLWLPGFLKLLSYWKLVRVRVCKFAPKPLLTSGVMWISYDWLNKFYSFYMAKVISTVSRCGLKIETHHRYQPTLFIRIEAQVFISYKRSLTQYLYEPFLHFTQALIYFTALNPCVYLGPGIYMSPTFIKINIVIRLG